MNRVLWVTVCVLLGVATTAGATQRGASGVRLRADRTPDERFVTTSGSPQASAGAFTTFVASFRFDSGPDCVTEGWTGYDFTEQTHDFWHVAGPAELDGGSFGSLLPLEGSQSMWCGAAGPVTAAEDPLLCAYATLPGYGNNWDQTLCLTDCLTGAGGVVVNASILWDSEAGYDATSLEVDRCDNLWRPVAGGIGVWDGSGSDAASIAVPDALHTGSLRIRFRFRSDNVWSDQDGVYDSDGAFLIDELSVTDTSGVRVVYEDFEDETPGDIASDDWQSCTIPGYGDFSGLYPGYALVQEDYCQSELDCVWAFISGSTVDYACGGWRAQAAVPYGNHRGQYIHNAVVSPDIPVAGSGSGWEVAFSVYRDLGLDPLVFYDWYVRSIDAAGCRGNWSSDIYVHFSAGNSKDWFRAVFPFGQFVGSGTTAINVALAVIDLCDIFCGYYGTGQCHSHAPLFDDVEVYRIATTGPQWVLDDAGMFQDTFSDDGTLTGTARADMAADIMPSGSPGIQPGDSACVTVSDADNGLGFHVHGDSSSGAAVYFYCHVDGPTAAATPAALVPDARYGYTGSSVIGGDAWYSFQMDSTRAGSGEWVDHRYDIDLNDNLFVPGDTVWFFFGARNDFGAWTWSSLELPTPTVGTPDIDEAAARADEFTILPAGASPGADLLYVDGVNSGDAQRLFEDAFRYSGYMHQIDRYDIRAPTSSLGNHPGARVTDAAVQLAGAYRNIVWSTGELRSSFSDGSDDVDKSDDTGALYAWLENAPGPGGGIYLTGDDVAEMWMNDLNHSSAYALRTKYMTFGLTTGNHVPSFGISPLGVGEAGRMFSSIWGPDTLVAYGGCPRVNDFDVLAGTGPAVVEMRYHGNGTAGGAVVSDTTTNPPGNRVTFVLSGFSFHEIRDAHLQAWPARRIHMRRVLEGLENYLDIVDPVPETAIARNELAQNVPNPFNPVTTIQYQVRNTGPVTLTIYNVAGQRVRTLVDGAVRAGEVHEVRWRGLNDHGAPVASGVYFYKLAAEGFVQTKKMVLLK